MKKLIKDRSIVDDSWETLSVDDCTGDIPAGDVLIPFSVWTERKEELSNRSKIGIWLESNDEPETLEGQLGNIDIIAINFPKFGDGRGYSIARVVRRLGYEGELRAIGDVLRDQLFFMQRCGFNSFAVRSDRDIENALQGLNDFSDVYQGAQDNQTALFNRR